MHKITSHRVGAAGRYHVLSQLSRRGWKATLDGPRKTNILITDENNEKLCAIQVKTRRDIGRDKGWHMKAKHETMVAPDLFYVFVDLGERPSDQITSYILPSSEVAKCIQLCYKVWVDTPGRDDQPHQHNGLRRLLPDHSIIKPDTEDGKSIVGRYGPGWLDPYCENWSILGLPEVDSL